MSKREYYIQLATSLAEEWFGRWWPFTLFGWRNWTGVIVIGLVFGAIHYKTYRDWFKTLLVLVFGGLFLNWLYVFGAPYLLAKWGMSLSWAFVLVVAIHFGARIVGKKLGL